MANPARRPLLFLDVDGTLLPLGGAQPPTTPDLLGQWQHIFNPQLAKLVPGHGPRLLALPCELMWATAWMHEANEVIAPMLGLPELPVCDLPEVRVGQDDETLHWKTQALVAAAAGRPFVWVDDEISDHDRAWVADNHQGEALLHRVESSVGLTDDDFTALTVWLESSAG
ncbi:hypothetical protein J4H86_19830 [Spiractinospora alimapuensis]|uniref:HAD domain-containing protein n=1 Tax=Spiractinospora alimapuensis TaxID=2820884 RepID=UPI001EEC65FD|nr:HAD domain-containing protein [Spiractinospora alimapuensis]QVQ51072.1 hypothetical protein J4H86_19830 [Spiractinospora alimapuensis]